MWLLTRPVVWPWRTGRFIGLRRLFVFGLGFTVGLLVAPVTGRELRDRLIERLSGPPLPGGSVDDRLSGL